MEFSFPFPFPKIGLEFSTWIPVPEKWECMIITYLKTGERDDIENCCLRAEGPKATIFNVVSFPCFEVRGNSIVS